MARNSVLVYGDSSLGKSSNLGEISDWAFTRYGGITRLITSDSGYAPMWNQIQRGVIEVWNIASSPNYAAVLQMASEGYWPEKINPETFVGDLRTLRKPTEEEWKSISGVSMEGLTKNADCLTQHILKHGHAVGEPLQGGFIELGRKMHHSSRGTYGFVQQQVLTSATTLCSLPVPLIVMTAHESKGEDFMKKTVFGPAVSGKALTDKMTSCFQMSFHVEGYNRKIKIKSKDKATGKDEEKEVTRPGMRAFFARHVDAEVGGVFWPAKLGLPPQAMARVLKRWPHNYAPLTLDENGNFTCSIATVLDFVEKIRDEDRAKLQEAPAE